VRLLHPRRVPVRGVILRAGKRIEPVVLPVSSLIIEGGVCTFGGVAVVIETLRQTGVEAFIISTIEAALFLALRLLVEVVQSVGAGHFFRLELPRVLRLEVAVVLRVRGLNISLVRSDDSLGVGALRVRKLGSSYRSESSRSEHFAGQK